MFKLDSAGTLTTLISLGDTEGDIISGGLIIDAAGNLFGTTTSGGDNAVGTVFRLDSGGILTTLASFDGVNGRNPYAGLVADAAGNLFGTTASGGTNNRGTIFRISDTGFVAATVPEPSTWAMMIGGFGLVGASARRRRALAA